MASFTQVESQTKNENLSQLQGVQIRVTNVTGMGKSSGWFGRREPCVHVRFGTRKGLTGRLFSSHPIKWDGSQGSTRSVDKSKKGIVSSFNKTMYFENGEELKDDTVVGFEVVDDDYKASLRWFLKRWCVPAWIRLSPHKCSLAAGCMKWEDVLTAVTTNGGRHAVEVKNWRKKDKSTMAIGLEFTLVPANQAQC